MKKERIYLRETYLEHMKRLELYVFALVPE